MFRLYRTNVVKGPITGALRGRLISFTTIHARTREKWSEQKKYEIENIKLAEYIAREPHNKTCPHHIMAWNMPTVIVVRLPSSGTLSSFKCGTSHL